MVSSQHAGLTRNSHCEYLFHMYVFRAYKPHPAVLIETVTHSSHAKITKSHPETFFCLLLQFAAFDIDFVSMESTEVLNHNLSC